jgi:hypothetical protein
MFLSPFRLQSNRPDGPKIGACLPAARITLARAAILGNSRDASLREFPVSADMQPASQAGCLFVGFDNSVTGGSARRFGHAT